MREGHLEETIRRVLAESLNREVRDPRIGFATISEVRLNRDNTVAQVYFTVMGDEIDRKKTLAGLRSCQGFLRQRIGDQLRLRSLPELRFRYDDSLDRSFQVERILGDLEESPSPGAEDAAIDDSDEGAPE